jgi:hypothetical protein
MLETKKKEKKRKEIDEENILNLDTFYFIGIWEYTINFRF